MEKLTKPDRITNRDILKFLHNAQLYSAEPVSINRVEELSVWAAIIKEEMSSWVQKRANTPEDIRYLDEHELVFVLVSIAHELQDQIMRKENRRCRLKDSRDMKSIIESCLI